MGVEIRVCRFAPETDLTPLTDELLRRGLAHRTERTEQSIDLYTSDEDLPQVNQLLDAFGVRSASGSTLALSRSAIAAFFSLAPITYLTVILGIIGAIIVGFRSEQWDWMPYLTYTKMQVVGAYIYMSPLTETFLEEHQWWRLITPAFLHFSLLHITFNTVAIIEFGRRLEVAARPGWYPALLVALAVASNTTQFMWSQSALFGGLSGVAYGLFGAVSVLYWRTGLPVFQLPKGFQIMILGFLLLGPLGVFELLFGVSVANPAHFSGLAFGALAGWIIPCRERVVRD